MSEQNGHRDSEILKALERLGAQFPWDTTAIWIEREPGGKVAFTAYIPNDYNRQARSAFGHGDTLSAACSNLVKEAGNRDPEAVRENAIKELKDNIAKLEAVNFGLPPYRPVTLLAPGALRSDIEV